MSLNLGRWAIPILICLHLSAATVGAVETWRPTAPAPDDETLVRTVTMRISGRPGIHVSTVQVEVRDGTLRLGGSVPDLHSRREVERLASSVRGLVAIENNLEVNRRDVPDSLLALEVQRLVDSYPRLRSRRLRAKVSRGVLELEGEVLLARDRLDAEEASARVPGVLSIRNRIDIAPADVDPDLIRRRLTRLLGNKLIFSGVEDLVVQVGEEGRVRLEGVVVTHADRLRAERLAFGLRGVSQVQNDLEVRRFLPSSDSE